MRDANHWFTQCKYPDAKIIIVDDADEFIKLINLILKNAGYHNIININDPSLATDKILQENPDVVLLDYEMPELSGLDILASIGNKSPDRYLPVLILTANTELDTRLQCLESGVQDFIHKPFDKLDLLLKLNNVIHLSMLYKRVESEKAQLGMTVRDQESTIGAERQSRLSAEEQLQHRLYHDLLTDLPNKILFTKYLLKDIAYANRNKTHIGIIVAVIDNLCDINYTLGHSNGDYIVQALAERFTSSTRQIDTVFYRHDEEPELLSRISGNSFAITVANLHAKEDCLMIANRIRGLLEQPILINDLSISPQCHMGIVFYPEHGEDADTLLKHADIAAYQAKKFKQPIEVYSSANHEFTRTKLELAHSIKQAINEDTFELYLQPKLSLHSHTVIGFECLLRWNHPEHGFVAPDKIVATAESTGCIAALSRWVIKHALSLASQLEQAGYPLTMAINVTASDLLSTETLQHLIDNMARYKVTPARITLELTEGTMVQDPVKMMEMINKYSELGLKLSIDDFGTGYSSLAYLQKLKVDELKIDRSFVMDLETNNDNQKIVQSIIDIAHHLNLSVVAEGIESRDVYDLLTEYKCDIAQGYYMAKPMPFADVLPYLHNIQPLDNAKHV